MDWPILAGLAQATDPDPTGNQLSPLGIAMTVFLAVVVVAAVAVPVVIRVRRRRARDRRLAREAGITATGVDTAGLVSRIRAQAPGVLRDGGMDPERTRVRAIEIVRLWPADGDGVAYSAFVEVVGLIPKPSGAPARRPSRRTEIWRLDHDGAVVATAPSRSGAADLAEPAVPEVHPSA